MNTRLWALPFQFCDLMNKAGKCPKSVSQIISQTYLLFIGEEQTNMAAPREAQT